MNRNAPRSIDQYLGQLREELAGADSALIQDALYDAEEYLRAEVAAHPDKSESDVLELIASTYGAPDEVAAAYRDTEVKVKAAMATPRKEAKSAVGRFFGVFLDPRAYTSLILHVAGTAQGHHLFRAGGRPGFPCRPACSVLIIGVPFFLMFMAICRVVSLAEGRLIEAMTGVRMPRRPVYQGKALGFWARIGEMLKDPRTWTTIAYFILMLPIGNPLLCDCRRRTLGESVSYCAAHCRGTSGKRVGSARAASRCSPTRSLNGYSTRDLGFPFLGLAGLLVADFAHAPGARNRAAARDVRQIHAGRAHDPSPEAAVPDAALAAQ